jgi:hypothetical protein
LGKARLCAGGQPVRNPGEIPPTSTLIENCNHAAGPLASDPAQRRSHPEVVSRVASNSSFLRRDRLACGTQSAILSGFTVMEPIKAGWTWQALWNQGLFS